MKADPKDLDAREAIEALAENGETLAIRRSALDTAVGLFIDGSDWETLVKWVPLRLKEAPTDGARVGVLAATAQILETNLERPGDAFDLLKQAIELDPKETVTRTSAETLATSLGRWEELVVLYEAGLEGIEDPESRFTLTMRLGDIYRDELARVDDAIGKFTAAATLRETDDAHLANLDELYAAAGRHDDRVAVLLRRSELATDEERSVLRKEAANVVNGALADPDRAISVWEGIRSDAPDDLDALEALTALYTRQGQWEAAADTLREHIALLNDDEGAAALAHAKRLVLAELLESRLDDTDGAIEAWEALKSESPEDALAHLDGLYRKAGRFADQADVLVARLEAQEDVAVRRRLARLYAGPLDRGVQAVEACSTVLDTEPQDPDTLALLETLATQELTAENALLALEMSYEEGEAWGDLARILNTRGQGAEGEEKLQLLDRVAKLRETKLDDAIGAFAATLEAYTDSGADPARRDELERLAEAVEAWGAYAMACESLAQSAETPELRRSLHLRAAELYAQKLHDDDEAAVHYQAMVEADSRDLEALRPLDAYYVEEESWVELIDIIDLEVLAVSDTDERVAFLHRLAAIQSDHLEAPIDAADTLRRIWSIAPADRQAFERLVALLSAAEDWEAVGGVITRFRDQASTDEAIALDFQLAEVQREHLDDAKSALDGYEAVWAADSGYAGVEDALWAIFTDDEDGASGIRGGWSARDHRARR